MTKIDPRDPRNRNSDPDLTTRHRHPKDLDNQFKDGYSIYFCLVKKIEKRKLACLKLGRAGDPKLDRSVDLNRRRINQNLNNNNEDSRGLSYSGMKTLLSGNSGLEKNYFTQEKIVRTWITEKITVIIENELYKFNKLEQKEYKTAIDRRKEMNESIAKNVTTVFKDKISMQISN
ncbi:hypothetical protein HN011_005314 [Eciton burchellii]|nr:hypothetical protein HN011_005314 [Eciton burchellii]